MTGWLLDTNVISELKRPRPEPRVVDFVAARPLDLLFVSAMTFAEIRFGIERSEDESKRADLRSWLDAVLRPMFERRVLPMTEDILLRWRLLVERGRKAGHTFSQPDLMIACTALEHGLTVVTRDTSGYALTGADIANPWSDT